MKQIKKGITKMTQENYIRISKGQPHFLGRSMVENDVGTLLVSNENLTQMMMTVALPHPMQGEIDWAYESLRLSAVNYLEGTLIVLSRKLEDGSYTPIGDFAFSKPLSTAFGQSREQKNNLEDVLQTFSELEQDDTKGIGLNFTIIDSADNFTVKSIRFFSLSNAFSKVLVEQAIKNERSLAHLNEDNRDMILSVMASRLVEHQLSDTLEGLESKATSVFYLEKIEDGE